MSAASASLKIGYTALKRRNLSPFHSAIEQPAFLRSVSPIFLTLTSQGGNQGMLTAFRELKVLPLVDGKKIILASGNYVRTNRTPTVLPRRHRGSYETHGDT